MLATCWTRGIWPRYKLTNGPHCTAVADRRPTDQSRQRRHGKVVTEKLISWNVAFTDVFVRRRCSSLSRPVNDVVMTSSRCRIFDGYKSTVYLLMFDAATTMLSLSHSHTDISGRNVLDFGQQGPPCVRDHRRNSATSECIFQISTTDKLRIRLELELIIA